MRNTKQDAKKLHDAEHILKTKLLVSSDDMAVRLEALTEADVRALATYVRMRDRINKAATEAVEQALGKGF